MSKCRSCGADILWVRMASGKAMPVDASPTVGGNIQVKGDGTASVASAEAVEMARGELVPTLHYSHFVTCPNADAHRKEPS